MPSMVTMGHEECTSPISQVETYDAIRIFSDLAETDDVETLRSVAEGLTKVAHKGWHCEIDAENGVSICIKLLQQPSPRVYTKGLALLNPLATHENCRHHLVSGGAVEFAWAYASDPESEHRRDYSAECWCEALQAVCHFACAPEQKSLQAVADCGGIQALVDNIGTSLTLQVTEALQNMSRFEGYHQQILAADALPKLIRLLSNETSSDETKTAAAATLANLADNTDCHHDFELNGVTSALLRVITDHCSQLRCQVARALASLCRVMQNQRNILIHKYLWNTYTVLAFSTNSLEQEVASQFYLYVSENESLADILQYTGIPVCDQLLHPLVALGYAPLCAEQASLAFANLASVVRVPMCGEDDALKLVVTWLEPGPNHVSHSVAVRILTTLTSQEDQSTINALHAATSFGAIPSLQALAIQNENVIMKCEVAKLLAMICKYPELHSTAIGMQILDCLLGLARSEDYVLTAEAVNAMSNLFNNCSCHAELVRSGGLICALEMAQADQPMLSTRGLTMLNTLCESEAAHPAMVRAGCLEFFMTLARTSSEDIRVVIANGFSMIATNEACVQMMCTQEYVTLLGTMAEERSHMLSSASLRLLMSMAERYYQKGVSHFATKVLADLCGNAACRDEMLENDGFARLSVLAGCGNPDICREISRVLSHFMDHASDVSVVV